MHMLTGELEKAKSESLLALERDALNVDIYLRMSELERATGDIQAAIDYARNYQEQKPEDIEAQIQLGDLLRDSGDLDAAEEHYKQAQILQNAPVLPTLKLSIIAARKGDINAAKNYLSEAEGFASRPMDKTHVRQAATRFAVRLGRIHEAIRLTRAQEEFLSQSSGLMEFTLSVYGPLIDLYVSLNDLEAATDALATQSISAHEELKTQMKEQHEREKEYITALSEFRRVVETQTAELRDLKGQVSILNTQIATLAAKG